MLLIVIPTVWIAIAAFLVVLCRSAARGDAALAARPQPGTRSQSFPGLVLFEDRGVRVAHDERLSRRVHAAAGPLRGRRARCVAR